MADGGVFARPAGVVPPLPDAIAQRAFWVLSPRLLAGAYPGDGDPAIRDRKIAALVELGMTDIVSLMEPNETNNSGHPFDPYAPAAEAAGVRVQRFPIRDVTAPSASLVTEILDYIDQALVDGGRVYVHCWGGRGRTGVIVGCWMVGHGWVASTDAVAELARLRSRCADASIRAPDTREQRDRISGWNPAQ